MDGTYHHQDPAHKHRPPSYAGGFAETPYAANRPPPSSAAPAPTQWPPSPAPTQPDHAGPGWTPPPGSYAHQGYGFNFPPGGGGFGGAHFAPPYGFDPSVPPPPFGCPPPAPVSTYSDTGAFAPQFRADPQPPPCDFQSDTGHFKHREYEGFSERRGPLLHAPPPGEDYARRPGTCAQPEDEATVQRRQDAQWIQRFLQSKGKPLSPGTQLQRSKPSCVPALREALYGAARLISALEESCEALKHNVENDCVWTDCYLTALNTKRELQDRLTQFRDGECLNRLKADLRRLSKRRDRRQRARKAQQMEEKRRQEEISEKDAAIDKWRMKKIHEVEEKKRVRKKLSGGS